jgi:hypothetical protein
MKRDERKYVKESSRKGEGPPHPTERDNCECHIDGSIHLRGEVETSLSPSLIEKHDTERREDAIHEQKKYTVELVTLITLGLYTLLTGYLAYETRISANAAIEAIKTAAQTMYLDERAWIAPQGAVTLNPPFGVGKPLTVRVGFENNGKSPATNVRMWQFKTTQRTNGDIPTSPPAVDLSKQTPKFYGTVMPYSPLASHFSDVPISSALLQSDYDAIRTDRLHIFIHGKMVYCDIFGREHWTTYCYHLLGGGAYEVCATDNEVDSENQPTKCPVTMGR